MEEEGFEFFEERLRLSDALEAVLASHLREWSAGMSDAFLAQSNDKMSQAGMPRNTRIYHMARLQVALHEALLARAPLTDAQRAMIIRIERLIVPIRKP